ncbi:MAG: polysaccharide deacetylase family protein [Actinobacteria bacterium]|nr:polysaccharide deacetylase family protein [Actinomycetota bacterium]
MTAPLVVSAVLATTSPTYAAPVLEVASPSVVARKPAVVDHIKTKDKVFFITIDDGWYRQKALADWVVKRKIPVTVFLTNQARTTMSVDHSRCFTKVASFGTVQNHTMTHKSLAWMNTNRKREICSAQSVYGKSFGYRPWMLRPPFGDGYFNLHSRARLIESVAASCGIEYIVLMHFEGDTQANMARLVRRYAAVGLKPARLENYLPKR